MCDKLVSPNSHHRLIQDLQHFGVQQLLPGPSRDSTKLVPGENSVTETWVKHGSMDEAMAKTLWEIQSVL